MKHQQFSKLNKRYKALKSDIEILEQKMSGDKEILSLKGKQLKEVRSSIDKLKIPLDPVVSNHAIIQYVERVLDYSVQEIVETILNPKIIEMIKESGDGHYTNNGFKTVVKNNVVVTIIKI